MPALDQKVTALTLLTGATIAGGDILYVADVSVGAGGSRGIIFDELVIALMGIGHFYSDTEVDNLLVTKSDIGHTHTFASITSKPTTLAGYGITDAANINHTHAFVDITGKPTTLAGYGITDAAAAVHTHPWSQITATPTTLAGYGITDAAPLVHTHNASDITAGTLAAARMPALTGDVTTAAGTVASTIAADAVDNSKLANMNANSIKLNNTGSAANPIDGTIAQLCTMINGTVAPSNYLPLSGGTLTGLLATLASAAGGAGLRLPHGAAPTSPTNGDIWTTTTGLFMRINGATQQNMTVAGGTMTGKITTLASAAGGAGFTLPHGAAPTAPVDGDVWSTSANFFGRLNGATITFATTSYVDTADALRAPLASPTFTGVPAAPTPSVTDDSTQIATTAMVQNAVGQQQENAQSGTTYTFALSDEGKMVTGNNASAITWTIPTHASVALPVGSRIDLLQIGVGQITIDGSAVTLRSYSSLTKLAGRYAGGTLWKQANNVWYLVGNLG